MSIRNEVERKLIGLDGDDALRSLFVQTLGYDSADGLLDMTTWPEDVRDEVSSQPRLVASGGRMGRFVVIHTRLKAAADVPIGLQRKVVERINPKSHEQYPNALFVFSDATDTVWHFVNVPRANESQNRLQYRRIVVGPNEGIRTPVERLSMLSLDDLAGENRKDPENLSPLEIQFRHDEAFDVAAVTKEFFKEYRETFEEVESETVGIEDEAERRYFVQRLFNRLMFIAFVQKKGWMKIEERTDYLPALWEAHGSSETEETFYEARLKPLFFRGFNSETSVDDPAIGKVPYLNGGLFEEDEYDDDPNIDIPDKCFYRIINRLFARYNFTTTESTPLEVEVAVDPEMLGKVFEELVTGRHDTGSYYTPKPIVTFMCREAIKGYLEERLGMSSEGGREAVREFVEDHDPSGISDPETALDALKVMRVCDPACGSGAYLLGMLRELLDLRESLFATHRVDSKRTYDRKLEIIQNNIYGVDMEQFAANIARLRLWLSLIVDFDGKEPPPLPNLDFKIGVGDSLSAPDPSGGFGNLDMFREQQIADHVELKAEYLRAHGDEKIALKNQIEVMREEIAEWAHPESEVRGFDWQVEFSEVFADEERPGFDAIVANPPYVRQERITAQKERLRWVFPDVYAGTADLYVYFYGRAVQLSAYGGVLSFITSNKWFRANYGTKLRSHLADNTAVLSITDFGDLPVFESATAYPMVFIAQRSEKTHETILTEVKSLDLPYPDVATLISTTGNPLPQDALDGSEWSLVNEKTASRLRRMRSAGRPLGEYVNGQIYYGIKTGLNKSFVIDEITRDRLISDDLRSEEIIKPLAVGRDLKRWKVNLNKWLIVTPVGVEIDRYPAVFEHLSQWQPELEARYDKGNHWWELRPCSYYDAFEKPRIMWGNLGLKPQFAFSYESVFTIAPANVIPIEDLYLLGLLNSTVSAKFFDDVSIQRGGTYLEFKPIYVKQFPVPKATSSDRIAIEELVEQCLAAEGENCEGFEAEIDIRVASLYGLDDLDVGVVS